MTETDEQELSALIDLVSTHGTEELSEWEQNFVHRIRRRYETQGIEMELSDAQVEKIGEIVEKMRNL